MEKSTFEQKQKEICRDIISIISAFLLKMSSFKEQQNNFSDMKQPYLMILEEYKSLQAKMDEFQKINSRLLEENDQNIEDMNSFQQTQNIQTYSSNESKISLHDQQVLSTFNEQYLKILEDSNEVLEQEIQFSKLLKELNMKNKKLFWDLRGTLQNFKQESDFMPNDEGKQVFNSLNRYIKKQYDRLSILQGTLNDVITESESLKLKLWNIAKIDKQPSTEKPTILQNREIHIFDTPAIDFYVETEKLMVGLRKEAFNLLQTPFIEQILHFNNFNRFVEKLLNQSLTFQTQTNQISYFGKLFVNQLFIFQTKFLAFKKEINFEQKLTFLQNLFKKYMEFKFGSNLEQHRLFQATFKTDSGAYIGQIDQTQNQWSGKGIEIQKDKTLEGLWSDGVFIFGLQYSQRSVSDLLKCNCQTLYEEIEEYLVKEIDSSTWKVFSYKKVWNTSQDSIFAIITSQEPTKNTLSFTITFLLKYNQYFILNLEDLLKNQPKKVAVISCIINEDLINSGIFEDLLQIRDDDQDYFWEQVAMFYIQKPKYYLKYSEITKKILSKTTQEKQNKNEKKTDVSTLFSEFGYGVGKEALHHLYSLKINKELNQSELKLK